MTATAFTGTTIATRPLAAGERSAIEAVFDGLGPHSRYQRFTGAKAVLTERDLALLTNVDHHDHEALLAVDERSGRPIGVARFVRDADDPGLAEIAFEVIDEWQARGVGSSLVAALVERARAEGIDRFRATALRTNERALALIRRLGRVVRSASDGPTLEVVIDLSGRRTA